MSLQPWLLGAAALGSVALIAGPVSAWTRRYVREPFNDANTTDAGAHGATDTPRHPADGMTSDPRDSAQADAQGESCCDRDQTSYAALYCQCHNGSPFLHIFVG